MTPSVSDLRGVARSGLESDTLQRADFAISSNPPNPRTSFRLGDWICSSPICTAHNFGRNVVCIGCGCPRSADGPPSPRIAQPSTRPLASPRFSTLSSGTPSETPFLCPAPALNHPIGPHFQKSPKPAVLSHPSLTPSGRAFSTTGKVQNISSDPLNPCVMYWPDNEPLPDQGQIRPCGLVGVPQPPILNTGNRGPIEHQPGDWICLKCSYLNWRRRKVCQTCYPYAEGNGDSISAAVQAERIALLTSVLAQSRITPKLSPSPTSSDSCDARASYSSVITHRHVQPHRLGRCQTLRIDTILLFFGLSHMYGVLTLSCCGPREAPSRTTTSMVNYLFVYFCCQLKCDRPSWP